MQKRILILIIGLIFLITWLFVGYPLELSNLIVERFATLFISLIIIAVLFLLFRITKKLRPKFVQIILYPLLIGISILYCFIGLGTIIISYGNGPIWEDTHIYTNQKGTKVISQFRETSGSIHDYRERLVLYEISKKNRISIDWSKKRMDGNWEVKDVNRDSTYIENFEEK